MARRTPSTTQGRTPLRKDLIVTSAIDLADREGLEAVTIRRLALDHNVTPMALYWHFREKDQLLDGIAERLYQGARLPEPSGGPWDEELQVVLGALLDALRPHPSVADVAASRIFGSTAGLLIAERALTALLDGGFDHKQAAEVSGFLLCSIIALVVDEPGPEPTASAAEREEASRIKKAQLLTLSPTEYPTLVACADAFAFHCGDDGYFDTGLALLVQGVKGISPEESAAHR